MADSVPLVASEASTIDMQIKYFDSCTFFLFLIIQCCSFSAAYAASSSAPTSSDAICNLTFYSDFCKSSLPQNKSTNINDFGRLSLESSLSKSRASLSQINAYLNSQNKLSRTTMFALQDCQFLISLNVDILSNATATIRVPNTLEISQYEDVETLLSATITNQDTCFDGLLAVSSASAIADDFSPSLTNGSRLCSISLALLKNGWKPKSSKTPRLLREKYAYSDVKFARKNLPFRISRFDRELFGSTSGRKLLQIGSMSINVTKSVTVNPDGTGNYTTINDAISAAPNNTKAGNGYFMIYVVASVYREYISIASNKNYLLMVGDGINKTIITGNHSVGDGWTTFNSPTFAVVATGFVAVNITIQNTAGAAKYQAVALRNGADLSTFYKCSFEGYQDTLYAHSMRQFYRKCDVYGTIDYIFGNAAVVLQMCNLYSRLPLLGQFNTITAQGKTDPSQNTGTSVHDCNILAAADLASSNSTTQTYLGRPWKQYSTTVYMQSFMDSLINPAGWAPWSGDFALNTSYYAEYNNTGPGSNTTNRVTWPGYHVINASQAVAFTVSNFIAGDFWLPATGVPYIVGLL